MRTFVFLLLGLSSLPAMSQHEWLSPPLSPPGRVIQQIGFTTIEAYYERPSARGRTDSEIFGSLVPFGKIWRTGAGTGTTISFSTDVIIGNKTIGKGKYALFTIPDRERWTVILNTDTLPYAAFNHDPARDVVRMDVIPQGTTRYYEALTIDIDFIPNDARVYISWLNTQISFDIHTGLDKKILQFIHDDLIVRDSDDPALYEAAIEYYLWHRQDRKQIMRFINRGIELKNQRRWYYWKVEELVKDKKYDEAQDAALAGIEVIKSSDEGDAARKAELIADFERYILKIEKLR